MIGDERVMPSEHKRLTYEMKLSNNSKNNQGLSHSQIGEPTAPIESVTFNPQDPIFHLRSPYRPSQAQIQAT